MKEVKVVPMFVRKEVPVRAAPTGGAKRQQNEMRLS
jgi:hypothetical protein